MQTLYLATNFNPIYWNTACLIVNSGSLEDNSEEEIVNIYEPEKDEMKNGTTYTDLPDRSGKIKKTASTDYTKVAKAIGAIKKAGIEVSLVDINKSKFGFAPDVENNQILFGLKGMLNVGDDVVRAIVENRPYKSPKDFIAKVNPNKQAMVSLIKGGAFDSMIDRKVCMGWYLWKTCDKKSKITLANFSTLLNYGLVPLDTDDMVLAKRIYEFNRYLKAVCYNKTTDIKNYNLDTRALEFLAELGIDVDDNFIPISIWEKYYQNQMETIKKWMRSKQGEILNSLNEIIFKEEWQKYAKGNLSSWEMEVLCFYYHEHELNNVNAGKYGIMDFNWLSEEPIVERSFVKGGHEIKIFELSKIAGTCIAKNKTKNTVSVLTPTGVVDVKFSKEYFAMFDKRISVRQPDGTKKIIEKSWFDRGNMIMIQGMRRGDNFIAKKYASTGGHQLYKIDAIQDNGDLLLKSERAMGEEDV